MRARQIVFTVRVKLQPHLSLRIDALDPRSTAFLQANKILSHPTNMLSKATFNLSLPAAECWLMRHDFVLAERQARVVEKGRGNFTRACRDSWIVLKRESKREETQTMTSIAMTTAHQDHQKNDDKFRQLTAKEKLEKWKICSVSPPNFFFCYQMLFIDA